MMAKIDTTLRRFCQDCGYATVSEICGICGDEICNRCGTLAAYRRHQRRGERICESCRQAKARDWADRVAAGRVPGRGPARVMG